jgi:two-component system, cell cycle response regulator
MPADLPLVYAIVEDDASMRRLIASIVRAGGDVAIEAGDYAHGEVLLREYPWDVAIIDRALPDGEGIELCAAFEPPPDSHRAVVILSAHGSTEDKMSGFDAGADEYVSKPFDPAELRSRLRAIGRRVHGQRQLLARVASLEQMSMIDGMTRVYNHRFFETELRRLHQTASVHKRPLSLIMLDIDFFKLWSSRW